MQLFSETGDFKLYHGSMLDMLEVIAPCSVDSIVTDPPYGLTTITKRFGGENAAAAQYGRDGSFSRLSKGFMGKEWDGSGIEYNVEAWRKCFTVLKSGGYLLAFGGSRTFHRIACAIEDAGFEIRDTIMWLYGSGFPKSMNIGLMIDKKNGIESEVIGEADFPDIRGSNYENNDGSRLIVQQKRAQNEWDGWGTALKPAYEPVIVARKPCEGSCVDNVIKYRTGGININGCRVGDDLIKGGTMPIMGAGETGVCNFATVGADRTECEDHYGRYPSNVILTYDETDRAEVCGGMPETRASCGGGNRRQGSGMFGLGADGGYSEQYFDYGSAARYYYCAKASKRDRDEGLELFNNVRGAEITGRKENSAGLVMQNGKQNPYAGKASPNNKNTHPTVKPTDLMQYLVRLVTPPCGTVLDPFNGSGSTGKACMYENRDRNAGYKYIGIELTEEYLPIADARIRFAAGDTSPVELPEKPLQGQITFFDILGGQDE